MELTAGGGNFQALPEEAPCNPEKLLSINIATCPEAGRLLVAAAGSVLTAIAWLETS